MEKIDFEDIRVGDVIEVHRTHCGGDTSTMRGTVKRVDEPYAFTEDFTFFNGLMMEYFLVERPKPTFKVGDTITGEQVADLPDGAVFDLNDGCVALWYKIDGEVFSAQGYFHSPSTYRETDYRDIKIVFLPEA